MDESIRTAETATAIDAAAMTAVAAEAADAININAIEVDVDQKEYYTPLVETVHHSAKEADDFWARLEAEAQAAAATPVLWTPAPKEERPYEERRAKLLDIISNRPSHRELLIRILSTCVEQKEFSRVEAEIQTFPEYEYAGQNPYRLISYLLDGEGLDLLEIGFDGLPLTDEIKTGLTEDEIDDLIDVYHLKTTALGNDILADLAPERRMRDLFSIFTDRTSFYTQIMELCREPRKFTDIEALFNGVDLSSIRTLHPESGLAIKPSVFVDNLEKAGAIAWNNGWTLTKEGSAYLKAMADSAVI